MKRFAFLCGSAPENFSQKKLAEMHDFLISDTGGAWCEKEIVEFPNGINEFLLECALNNAIEQEHSNRVFLYICTERPVEEKDLTFWLGNEQIQKDIISHFESISNSDFDFQVIYDVCSDFISDEVRGYENVTSQKYQK